LALWSNTTRQVGRCRAALLALALLSLAAAIPASAASLSSPGPTRVVHTAGRIVPIPASIPHEPGDRVDSRIIPDLRWIAARFPIYITDGYSGPLPGSGRHVGCNGCHAAGSDHHYGLAVDIVPQHFSTTCDRYWRPITRLAHWAEPRQNHPNPPFDWVGYDGDAGHGCGNHLHLGWTHAPGPEYRVSSWVEVFAAGGSQTTQPPPKQAPKAPTGPQGGVSPLPPRVTGGISPDN
jgi:hypothetical protein